MRPVHLKSNISPNVNWLQMVVFCYVELERIIHLTIGILIKLWYVF